MEEFDDPFLSILQLKYRKISRNNITNPVALEIYDEKLPEISSSEISRFAEMLKSGCTYNETLQSSAFQFVFLPQLLEMAITTESFNATEKELVSKFVLFSYVSWVLVFEKIQSVEYITLMLRALTLATHETCHSLATSAFLYIMKSYIELGTLEGFKAIFDVMSEYFLNAKYLPDTVFFLFPGLLKLIARKHQEGKQDTHDFQLIVFITVLMEEREMNVPQDAAYEIIMAVRNELQNLRIYELDLWSHLSCYFAKSAITEVTKIVADGVSKYIQETDTDVLQEGKKIRFGVSKLKQVAEFVLNFPNVETMVGIDEYKEYVLPGTDINLEDIVDVSLQSSLQFVVKAAQANPDIADVFVNSLAVSSIRGVAVELFCLRKLGIMNQNLSGLYDFAFNLEIVCDDTSTRLSAVRQSFVQYVMELNEALICNLLDYAMQSPLLYLETVMRCKYFDGLLKSLISDSVNHLLLKQFSHSLSVLQAMSYRGITDVDEIRWNLLNFVFYLCDDDTILPSMFNRVTVLSLLGHVFEPNIRDLIIDKMKVYMAKARDIQAISYGMEDVLTALFIAFPDPRSIELADRLLQLFLEMLNKNLLMVNCSDSFFNSALALDTSDVSAKYLLNFIRSLDGDEVYGMNKCRIERVASSLLIVFGENPPAAVIETIKNVVTRGTEHIHQVSLLEIMLLAYPHCDEWCTFVSELLNDPLNVKTCHDYGFDRLLGIRLNDTKYYRMYAKIAEAAASEESIKDLIKSEDSVTATRMIRDVTESVMRKSKFRLPLSSNNRRETVTISSSNRLCFVCMLSVSEIPDGYTPLIFRLQTNSKFLLDVFIQKGNVHINFDGDDLLFEWNLDSGQNSVAINFTAQTIELWVLSENCGTIKRRIPSSSEYKLEIGGIMDNSIDVTKPLAIEEFSVYESLSRAQIQNRFTEKPLYKRNLYEGVTNQSSLVSVIIKSRATVYLLALLKNAKTELFTYVLSAISNLILASDDVEQQLMRVKATSIISFRMASKVGTYDEYLLLFRIFENSSTNQFKILILRDVLMNLGLWMNSSSSDQLAIAHHWKTELTVKYAGMCQSMMSFSQFLTTIMNNCRQNRQVRTIMYSILLNTYSDGLTKPDFGVMMGFCFSQRNLETSLEMLHLLMVMAKERRTALLPAANSLYDYLNLLLQTNTVGVASTVIDLVIELHENNIIKEPSLHEHVYHILKVIHPHLLTEELLNHCLVLLRDGADDIFQLCCLCAYALGNDAVERLFKEGTFSSEIYRSSYWAVWPVLLLNIVPSEHTRKEIMMFLANSGKENWETVLNTIDMVCEYRILESTKANFLNQLVENGEIDESLVLNFMFYREQGSNHMSTLQSRYFQSPYFTRMMLESEVDFAPVEEKRRSVVFKELRIYDCAKSYGFGIRISNGKWEDSGLALKCLPFVEHTQLKDLMAYFLVKTGAPFDVVAPHCSESLAPLLQDLEKGTVKSNPFNIITIPDCAEPQSSKIFNDLYKLFSKFEKFEQRAKRRQINGADECDGELGKCESESQFFNDLLLNFAQW